MSSNKERICCTVLYPPTFNSICSRLTSKVLPISAQPFQACTAANLFSNFVSKSSASEMGAGQSTDAGQAGDGQAKRPEVPPSALVICGPSGVGKGTLIKRLMTTSPQAGSFGFSCSHTTREPRANEVVRPCILSILIHRGDH